MMTIDNTLKLKNVALKNMKTRTIYNRESKNQIISFKTHENNEDICSKIDSTYFKHQTRSQARHKNVPEEPKSIFVLAEKWFSMFSTISDHSTKIIKYAIAFCSDIKFCFLGLMALTPSNLKKCNHKEHHLLQLFNDGNLF